MAECSGSRALEVALVAAWTQVRQQVKHPLTLLAGLVTPLMFATISAVPQEGAVTGPEATRILTGSLLAAFWSVSVWGGVSILRRERDEGTLAATLIGAHPPSLIVLARTLGGTALALVVTLPGQLLAVMILGLRPQVEHPAALVPGFALVVLSGTCVCFLLSVLLVATRYGFQISSMLGAPILLLGGTVLPIAALPSVLVPVSRLIPLSWLQQFLVSSAGGSPDLGAAGVATLLSLCYGLAGGFAFRLAVRRARVEATLDLI